jgi:dihydromethanopterin reductase
MKLDIRLIAAVGRSGQIGLDGRLPWSDQSDMKSFRDATMGCGLIMGARTASNIRSLEGRYVWKWHGADPGGFLDRVAGEVHRFPGTIQRDVLWIAGGAATYAAFWPFVRTAVITQVDYDGPADTFMPPLWSSSKEVANG